MSNSSSNSSVGESIHFDNINIIDNENGNENNINNDINKNIKRTNKTSSFISKNKLTTNNEKIEINPDLAEIVKVLPVNKKKEVKSHFNSSSISSSSNNNNQSIVDNQNESILSETNKPNKINKSTILQKITDKIDDDKIATMTPSNNQKLMDNLNINNISSQNINNLFSKNFLNPNKSRKSSYIFNQSMMDNGETHFHKTLSIEKKTILKEKFQLAKEKMIKNKNEFLENIQIAIQENNIKSIRDLMLNKENQKFYKLLLQSSNFLNMMLTKGRMEMLSEVLSDPFYVFDETFVFNYLSKKLKQKNKLVDDMQSISTFISNVVQYKLYRKSLTIVLGWFIICFGLNEEFIELVKSNEKSYSLEYIQYNHFETEEDIADYVKDPSNYRKILILCLKEKLENLAIELVIFRGELENSEIIESALQYKSKVFLRYIWEATNNIKNNNEKKKSRSSIPEKDNERKSGSIQAKKKSHLQTFFESSMYKTVFNQGCLVFMLSDLIDKIYKFNISELVHDIVSTWNYLNKDKNLLQALLRNKAYDEISILLYRYPNVLYWKFTPENFKEVILNNGMELILLCLQDKNCREILEETEIQKIIVNNYLSVGHKMYYGAEMLNNIGKNSLDLNLVINLLNTIEYSLKNKLILNCHSPVLTSLILCEILSNISEISVHFSTKCNKTKEELMTFCKNIHDANPNEKYIKFLLGQKDSKGRTAYQIAAEISAFLVLESPEVGTIVNKMWVGKVRQDGILSFSSMKKFLESHSTKGNNPFKAFEPIDKSKSYYHQLFLWEESCSLRFYPESLSTILLIILYNLFIYFIVSRDEVMNDLDDLPKELQIMLICYIIWTSCIVLNIPLQILYCHLSGKRKYKVDIWVDIEILLCISSYLTLIDTEKIFPNKDENGHTIPSDGKSDWSFVLRASILSINDIFVWLRITGILLTYKELGPLIRMIYLLSIITGKYLLIYLILMICCATIYTTLFFRASKHYVSYSITFTTLFQGYLNNGTCFEFEYYEMFGAILVIAFITVGGLILVNILIALLSNEYTELSKVVDAAHRSVLITYYKKLKWDKNYGYLILLTTPLTVLNFIVLPINLLFQEKKKIKSKNEGENEEKNEILDENEILKLQNSRQQNFNKNVSSLYFILFYYPIIFILCAVLNIILIPISYIVGIFSCFSEYTVDGEKDFCICFLLAFAWLILGIPFLLYLYLRDLLGLFSTIFIEFDVHSYDLEKKRIKDVIKPNDIRTFLTFIHKREKNEQNDLHCIFNDFLDYENQQKAEYDKEFQTQVNYLDKVRKAGKNNSKKSFLSISNSNLKMNQFKIKVDQDDETGINGRITKRNLIIIEILENFLIDDGSDNYIVDIDKMKMLLPKTMNINNAYIKRLVHTGITSLNKAVNKRKNKANAFLQHKLLNKIVGSIVRLDNVIDGEGNTDPLSTEEAKRKNQFDIEENEDNFYSTLDELLRKINDDVGENIKRMERKIYEEENKINGNKNKKEKKSSYK